MFCDPLVAQHHVQCCLRRLQRGNHHKHAKAPDVTKNPAVADKP
jgi:hypothetical protein